VFAGTLTPEDVTRYLRAHDHIGCGSMFMTAFGVGLILLSLAIVAGGTIGLMILGILGWLALMLMTSLLTYRRSVFTSGNPAWDWAVHGQLEVEGLRIHRRDAESRYRWDWFGGTIVGEQVVAFLPALHPHQPVLFTPSMMSNLDDWDRLVGVARTLGAAIDPMSNSESRKYDNRAIVRSRKRKRSIPVPRDAIAFEGIVSMSDLKYLPPVMLRRNRPTRAYMLIAGLAIFASFVLIGTARMSGFDTLIPSFLIVLVALPFLMLFLVRRIRSLRSVGDTIYYLTAFADETGVTSDSGVTGTFVPWHAMHLSEINDEAVALSRPGVRQFIVARNDMFDHPQGWQRFQEMVRKKLT
jgi:hypothetical protein